MEETTKQTKKVDYSRRNKVSSASLLRRLIRPAGETREEEEDQH